MTSDRKAVRRAAGLGRAVSAAAVLLALQLGPALGASTLAGAAAAPAPAAPSHPAEPSLKLPPRLAVGETLLIGVEPDGLRSISVWIRGDEAAAVRFYMRADAAGRLQLRLPYAQLPKAARRLLVFAEVEDGEGRIIPVPAGGARSPLVVEVLPDKSAPRFEWAAGGRRFPAGEPAVITIRPVDDSGRIVRESVDVLLDGVLARDVQVAPDLIVVSFLSEQTGPHRLTVRAQDPAGNAGEATFDFTVYRPLRVRFDGEFSTRSDASYRSAEASAELSPRLAAELQVGTFYLGGAMDVVQPVATAGPSAVVRYEAQAGVSAWGRRLALDARAGRFSPKLSDITLAGRSVEEGWQLDGRLVFIEAGAFFGRLRSRTADSYARHVMGAYLAPLALGDAFSIRLGAAMVSDQYVDASGSPIPITDPDTGEPVEAQENLVASLQVGGKLWALSTGLELAVSASVTGIEEAVPYDGGELVEGMGASITPAALYRYLPASDARALYHLFPVPVLKMENLIPIPVGSALRWYAEMPVPWVAGSSVQASYTLADSGYRVLEAPVPAGTETMTLRLQGRLGNVLRLRLSASDEREVFENVLLSVAGPPILEMLGQAPGDGVATAELPERERRLSIQGRTEWSLGALTVAPFASWSLKGTSVQPGLAPALLRGAAVRAFEGVERPALEQLEAGAQLRRIRLGRGHGAPVLDVRGSWIRQLAYEAGASGSPAVAGQAEGWRAEAGLSAGAYRLSLGGERVPDAGDPAATTQSWKIRAARTLGIWSLSGGYGLMLKPLAAEGTTPPEHRGELQATLGVPFAGGTVSVSASLGAAYAREEITPAAALSAQYGVRW